MKIDWKGVFPAVTTLMKDDGKVDLDATGQHVSFLIESGVHGLVMLGTVGENTSLSKDEKISVVEAALEAAGGRVPVISGVAEYTTALGCEYANACKTVGVDGLMALPGMVYKADEREVISHFRSIANATDLPVMIYNNPVAYGIDVVPESFAQLEDLETIVAIKESSERTKRIVDLTNLYGDRFVLFCGVDDVVVESVANGALGWVSGLVNAFPEESVRLFELAGSARLDEAQDIYRWFMPLLHLDTYPKLVQYIKLVQHLVLGSSEVVRTPRLTIGGDERRWIETMVEKALAGRPLVHVS